MVSNGLFKNLNILSNNFLHLATFYYLTEIKNVKHVCLFINLKSDLICLFTFLFLINTFNNVGKK